MLMKLTLDWQKMFHISWYAFILVQLICFDSFFFLECQQTLSSTNYRTKWDVSRTKTNVSLSGYFIFFEWNSKEAKWLSWKFYKWDAKLRWTTSGMSYFWPDECWSCRVQIFHQFTSRFFPSRFTNDALSVAWHIM